MLRTISITICTLLRHFGPPVSLKTYFRVDHFKGVDQLSPRAQIPPRSLVVSNKE
jgi:hypothetical protein